ncbi:hypothetical protein Bca4012_090458 [Brassica carinata]
MAWLARSIANSLKLDEDDDDVEKPRPGDDESAQNQSVSESQSPRGVKDDISELTKTLRSQFWGEWRRVYVMQHIEMASRASEVIAFVTEWPAALSLEACVNVLGSFREIDTFDS